MNTLFRDLTDRTRALETSVTRGIINQPFEFALVDEETNLFVKYFRLQSHRQVPSIQTINTFKFMQSQAKKFPVVADPAQGIAANATANLFETTPATYLIASGRDARTLVLHDDANAASATMFQQIAPVGANNYYVQEINNVSYPQLPAQLVIVFQKDVNCFSSKVVSGGDDKSMRAVSNRSSNASIRKLELQIQTSERVYHFSADASALQDQQILYEESIKNCTAKYFGFKQWQKSQCCVVLNSSSYCPLGLSPGTIMPVQISIRCEIENKNVVYDGYSPIAGVQSNAGASHARPTELAMQGDRIRGRLNMIAVYTRGSATISPSSCVLSTQGIAQSQATRELSQYP